MLVVGLTGGIGSGKSTVASLLADKGAVVVDADVLAREVVAPGTDGFREVVAAFGDEVVGPDGALDRAAVAERVFSNPERRRRLEAITHPRVVARMAETVAEHAAADRVIVLDIPLLAESKSGSASLVDAVVVVDAHDDVRLARLKDRGMSEEDARARMAAQASREERLALADHVIDNSGTVEELRTQVDELWKTLSV